MSTRSSLAFLLFQSCVWICSLAVAQSTAAPGGPLVCHKEVCPVPASPCQVLESSSCVHGGGPPRCPAIVNAPTGTSCNDGSVCTTNDVCSAGVCGGTPVVCSSPTDTCTRASGCGTTCGASGCVVAAAGGYLNPTLTVPVGALSSSVVINMVDLGGDANDASVFHVYSFTPAGTTFAIPATVDLPAPPLLTGQIAVIEVSDDGSIWAPIATTASNGRVTGPIAHFSKCRTRAAINPGSLSLVVLDMVGYQEAIKSAIPPPGEAGSCYSGDFFGLCFKIKNSSATKTITSSCPAPPTPTNPPPPGCEQVHVVPWQCSSANRILPPFDPSNPGAYEGQHCDRAGGFVIPCAESVYNMDQFLPLGGLAPGQELWLDLNFVGATARIPANGVNPYSSCIAGSGFFIGFDVVFREPSGGCAPGTLCDWQGGIRSAKLGPFVDVPLGAKFFLPAGVSGCVPAPGATTCPVTCASTSCKIEWEWLVNHAANYPTLRCERAGALIDCSQALPGDVVNKNWLIDSGQ